MEQIKKENLTPEELEQVNGGCEHDGNLETISYNFDKGSQTVYCHDCGEISVRPLKN